MNLQEESPRLPELYEYDFRSSVPVIGPLISLVRRWLYSLTAKWGVWVVIQQQNRINRMVETWFRKQELWLHEQGALLVDLDRDLTLLARAVAEMEVRQRHLAKMLADRPLAQNQEENV
jgi:hypothetical protein